MAGPYSVECYTHRAAIGVPCTPTGTCCANRITRALLIGAGVAPSEVAEATTAAIDPGKAWSVVVGKGES